MARKVDWRWEFREDFGWPETVNAQQAATNKGMVVHWDSAKQGLASKSHMACHEYWKNTRKFHMGPSRGWNDIGYSYAVCPHGYIMEGRGYGVAQAAQPGGNFDWLSCTFMCGPGEVPTTAQLEAWDELREWFMGLRGRSAVKGHRDFVSTDCPGPILYAMVQDGSLRNSHSDWMGRIMKTLPTLRVGDIGYDVKTLRAMLYQRGYAAVDSAALAAWLESTAFDAQLQDWIVKFQQDKRVDDDGIVGPVTWQLLFRVR